MSPKYPPHFKIGVKITALRISAIKKIYSKTEDNLHYTQKGSATAVESSSKNNKSNACSYDDLFLAGHEKGTDQNPQNAGYTQ